MTGASGSMARDILGDLGIEPVCQPSEGIKNHQKSFRTLRSWVRCQMMKRSGAGKVRVLVAELPLWFFGSGVVTRGFGSVQVIDVFTLGSGGWHCPTTFATAWASILSEYIHCHCS